MAGELQNPNKPPLYDFIMDTGARHCIHFTCVGIRNDSTKLLHTSNCIIMAHKGGEEINTPREDTLRVFGYV